MKKFCNHCGKLYIDKCTCRSDTKREYRHNNFYDSNGWKSVSRFVRLRDFNMDRLALYFCKCTPMNDTERQLYNFVIDVNGQPRRYGGRLTVHHIKELASSWTDRYNTDNLITVESHVHEFIHQLYSNGKKETVQALLFKAVQTELP